MAIRTWSFTKLWAVSAGIWLVAWMLAQLLDYFDGPSLFAFAIASVPAFLAGAWAAAHPEIAEWPRIRLGALWAFVFATFVGASECLHHWGALAVTLAAPAAVLSLRWYELTRSPLRFRELPSTVITPPPPPPAPPRLPPRGS
jgi:hypothetical protein